MTKWRAALIASLLLNLFLAAALVAGALMLRSGEGAISAGSLHVAGAELQRPERHQFRQALQETRRGMEAQLLASERAKMRAAELLRQASPDPASIDAALDQARAADLAVREAVERRAVAIAVSLSPTARGRLADAMERRGRSGSECRFQKWRRLQQLLC